MAGKAGEFNFCFCLVSSPSFHVKCLRSREQFDDLVLWSRSMVVQWSRWAQQNERGYPCKSGLYTTLALRLSKAGAPLASPCCPCSDPPATHLRPSASAYQDACMNTSSPFLLPSLLFQGELISLTVSRHVDPYLQLPMYPCIHVDARI